MAAGIPNLQNILKVGFLNEHPEELLARYLDIYDIVLVNDSTCKYFNHLKYIFTLKKFFFFFSS